MAVAAERYHDFCAGHRVVGHEGKCRNLHGHNYRVHFACAPIPGTGKVLDEVGRVIDFSVIKETLCDFLEKEWDHKMLIWSNDPLLPELQAITTEGIAVVPFNPTAENMGLFLLNEVGPHLLMGTGVRLIAVRIEETRKCAVTVTLPA